ncbi:MAG TPA: hypothetical protein VJT80_12715 [Steroidobacteraceae bacterium]|nr:hypothetical protein [Steroidobacteraceae bacterium]
MSPQLRSQERSRQHALAVMKDKEMAGSLLIVFGAVALCVALAWFIRSRVAEQYVVRLSDIPQVYEQLKAEGSNQSFAVFMFSDHGKLGEAGQVNLQFSIENGTVGLDWVLIGPVNVRDEQRIFDFLKARGSMPTRLEANGVGYLRTEKGDLVQLCQHIIKGLYGVKATEDIDLVPEGFSWKS